MKSVKEQIIEALVSDRMPGTCIDITEDDADGRYLNDTKLFIEVGDDDEGQISAAFDIVALVKAAYNKGLADAKGLTCNLTTAGVCLSAFTGAERYLLGWTGEPVHWVCLNTLPRTRAIMSRVAGKTRRDAQVISRHS
jgi:hypothetical protein